MSDPLPDIKSGPQPLYYASANKGSNKLEGATLLIKREQADAEGERRWSYALPAVLLPAPEADAKMEAEPAG